MNTPKEPKQMISELFEAIKAQLPADVQFEATDVLIDLQASLALHEGSKYAETVDLLFAQRELERIARRYNLID